MLDSRDDPTHSPDESARDNRALVERYFQMVSEGNPEIASLFTEDACWVAPQTSPVGERHEGRSAVLELMARGTGLYDATRPLEIVPEAIAAEGDHVFVEMTMTATTGQGAPYRNHYVFVFRMREGRIAEVHEHLDTLYAQRLLFDPVGQRSPLEARDGGASGRR